MTIHFNEQLQAALKAMEEANGNVSLAARRLGVPRTTLRNRLREATIRGLGSHFSGSIPEGLVVSGTSTLYNENGKVSQWVKTKVEPALEDVIAALRETFEAYKEQSPIILPPYHGAGRPDLLTVYPIADLHFGMYSWMEETGVDYDMYIASKLLRDTAAELIAGAPSSDRAVVLNLGDFFHSDSNENRTRRAGNALDVDTRYAKVLRTGCQLLIDVVVLALQKHDTVVVRNIPGNHDPYAALALTLALDMFFKGDPRVTVDTDPSPFWFYTHGKVMLGATHGDMVKIEDMAGVMAAKQPVEWGKTVYRYVYAGHIHKNMKKLISEGSGAQLEVFETLAPRDAWGNSMGFTANRSMVAITHHRERGEVSRLTQNIAGPK